MSASTPPPWTTSAARRGACSTRFHACFNAGAVSGAILTGALRSGGVPYQAILAGLGALYCLMLVAIWRIPAPVQTSHATQQRDWRGTLREMRANPTMRLIAVILCCGLVIEGTMGTWATLYLRGDIGLAAWIGGIGYALFNVTMTIGRLMNQQLARPRRPARRADRRGLRDRRGQRADAADARAVARHPRLRRARRGDGGRFPDRVHRRRADRAGGDGARLRRALRVRLSRVGGLIAASSAASRTRSRCVSRSASSASSARLSPSAPSACPINDVRDRRHQTNQPLASRRRLCSVNLPSRRIGTGPRRMRHGQTCGHLRRSAPQYCAPGLNERTRSKPLEDALDDGQAALLEVAPDIRQHRGKLRAEQQLNAEGQRPIERRDRHLFLEGGEDRRAPRLSR